MGGNDTFPLNPASTNTPQQGVFVPGGVGSFVVCGQSFKHTSSRLFEAFSGLRRGPVIHPGDPLMVTTHRLHAVRAWPPFDYEVPVERNSSELDKVRKETLMLGPRFQEHS